MVDIATIRARSLRLLREEARRKEEEELLDSFHPDVQLCVIEENGPKAPLSQTLADLRRSIEARKTLHDLERGMDKDYFAKLVSGGFLLTSGFDRETGSVATWLRVGDFFKSSRRIPAGSPKEKALIRAFIWLIETLVVQNVAHPDVLCMVYTNCDMGPLYFNVMTMKAVLTLLGQTFQAYGRTVNTSFGINRVIPLFWNMLARFSPGCAANTRFLESYSDALDMVTDPSDVPECWLSDIDPSDRCRLKRTNTWCFERCLSDDNRVTTKDLFNPEPWPYGLEEEVDMSKIQHLVERGARRAETQYELLAHSEEPRLKLGTKLEKVSSPLTFIEEEVDEP